MGDGGVASAFRFDSYKIDRISYESIPNLNFLGLMGTLDPKGWKFDISFREPLYFKYQKKYVGAIDVTIAYPVPPDAYSTEGAAQGMPQVGQANSGVPEPNIVRMEIGIAGIFSVEEGRFEKEIEENLVKIQIPMLLLPYLRGAATSIFAHSGIGSVIFPLINLHELAKGANLAIKEIE